MKGVLRVVLRLLLFLVALVLGVVLAWLVLFIVFAFAREIIPWLKVIAMWHYQIWSFLILSLAAVVLYLWSLTKPVLYMLTWLKRLAQGQYDEPLRSNWRGRPVPGNRIALPYSLFKEIIGQMSTLTRALQRTEYERRELDENRKNWIAGVRHDLKTPLAYIRGYGSMLAATDQYAWSSVEIIQFGALMEQKAIQAEQLIEDMNASYQLDSSEVPLKRESVEMVGFIRQIVADIAEHPLSARHTFAFDAGFEQQIEIDSRLIRRALHNLVWNAVVHNPAGCHIETELRLERDGLLVEIRDNGAGIEAALERLNAGENNLLSAQARLTGSGLGMALAKDFVTRHGGRMTVHSRPQQGTQITIYFSFFLDLAK
ncbi:sensor histidine kinase [Paenibacillus sp. HW567]|uniref:sensor histidine kinase n=1 Tax=Paenibacillus sp. HW567 TaxID=1034769 RepID=UPI00036B81F4|nr:HAMP domain-containing sensor histidine kinase [Paenibacillus sp. HW567]